MAHAVCDLCRASFPESEFSEGGAVQLLGRKICRLCVEKATLYCHFCRAVISQADFEEGRAVTLLGKRYCEGCLAAAVERSKPSGKGETSVGRPIQVPPSAAAAPAAPPSGAELRTFERFVPPHEARLFIRPPGIEGFFGKSRVRMWLDLSEGGVRAILDGTFEKGDEVEAEIRYPPAKARHAVLLKVRHAHPSKSFAGCSVVGFKFVDPDSDLRELVRTHLRKHPLLAEQEKEKEPPAPKAG